MEWYMLHTSFCLLLLLIIHQATTQSSVNTLASTDTTTSKVTSEGTSSSVLSSTTTASATTTPVTTTQPPMIGDHCVNSSTCAHLNNAECINNNCLCRNDSFSVYNRTCLQVSYLEPEDAFLVVGKTFITLMWSPYSEPVGDLIKNGTLEIVVKVKELPMKNCSVNTSANYAYCTGQNLTYGAMYTMDFIIIQVQSNITVYNNSFSNSSVPGMPGAINKTSEFHAPNISLNWEASPGLVDNYTVTVAEVNENKSVIKITHNNSTRIEVNGLRHGRNHTVVIVANRFDKTSDQRTDNFSTVIIPPEPPTNLSVMPGSIGKDILNLTWTRPVDFNGPPQGYKVCVKKKIYSDELWSNEDCITKDPEIVEWMEVFNLTAGAFYWFTVYSLNSKFTSTPASSGIVQTNESTPDVVTDVKLKPFGFNMEVNFTRPKKPYGKIVAYNINIRNLVNDSDCRVWWLETPGYTDSQRKNWRNCSLYPPTNIFENQKDMFINMTELLPDSFYWIEIMARTSVGLGIPVDNTIHTSKAELDLGSPCLTLVGKQICKDPNAACNGGKCACDSNYYDDNDATSGGTCQPKVGLGSNCPHSDACITANASCNVSSAGVSNICVCNMDYYDNNGIQPNGTCRPVSDLQVTSLVSGTIHERSITISWTAPTGKENFIDHFVLTYGPFDNTGSEIVKNVTLTNVTLENLVSGKKYRIRIVSVNRQTALSERTISNTFYKISKPSIPGILQQRENIDVVSGKIALKWNTSEGVVNGYAVSLANETYKYIQSFSNITTTQQTFTQVRSGTIYRFSVYAVSGDTDTGVLNSDARTDYIRTTVQIPNPPTNLSCLNPTDRTFILTWMQPQFPNGDIISYIIAIQRTDPSQEQYNVTSQGTSEQYTVEGLTSGSIYKFQVYTRNELYTSILYTTVESCQTIPQMAEMPTELQITDVTSRSGNVTWSKPTNFSGIHYGYSLQLRNGSSCNREVIWRCMDCGGSFPTLSRPCSDVSQQNVSSTALQGSQYYEMVALLPDNNYTVDVATITGIGIGHKATKYFATKEEAPSKPSIVLVRNITAKTATVEWNMDGSRPGQTNYIIIATGISPAEMRTHSVSGFVYRKYEFIDLEEYRNYSVTVQANTSIGSNLSDPYNFTTLAGPAGPVNRFIVNKGLGDDMYMKARVSWILPDELKRNGPINSFYVQQRRNYASGTSLEVNKTTIKRENDDTFTYYVTFDVLPEANYTFMENMSQNGYCRVYFVRADTGSLTGEENVKNYLAPAAPTGNVSRPVVRPEIQRLSSYKNQLVFYCDIDPLSDISMLYQVTWYRDRFETGSKLMSTTYIPYNSREIFRSLTYLSEEHITLGMTIFCSISATKLNITTASEPYFVGFEMTSNNSLKLQYSEEALIYIRLTVPFGCQRQSEECFLGVNMFYMETGADNCLLPVAAALSSCGVRISSWRWNQSYALRLANKHGQNLHSISRTYNIRFKTDAHFDHDFFRNYTLPRDIQVEATSNSSSLNGKECHAICDPHMQTFDGRYYENQNEGTYILYKNLKIPVQVQMRTNPCYGFKDGPPFCPCGVAIAAGRDVFVVDRCSIPITIYMPQCDEGILQGKIKSDGNIYQVHLPSGSWVIITSGISFNIYIYPSLSDHMTTSGLCGYLDSEIQNDFMLRNRTTVPDNKFEDFNLNWLVKPEEDLFNTSNYLYLPGWPREDYFCICEEYQHGYVFRSDNCSPDSRKFCPESTLNDSLAADCSRKLSTNVSVPVQLDPSDFNVSQSRNDTTMPKRNFTEDSANYECWSYLNSSLLFKKCSEVPDIVPESFANTCTKDALITKTMFWAATHLDNAQKQCIYQVTVNQPLSEQIIKENNVTLNPDEPARNKTTNETDVYTSALLQELKDMACPMNCTDQGICTKGQCICWKGYGGNDCSVDLNKAPDVYGIPNRGVCDLHKTSCDHASILGYNFADSPNMSCRLSLFQVKRNERRFYDNNSIILKAKWISFAEISCPIADVRSKRSVEFPDDLDTLAIGYSVAVGNNREIFGRNISLLILDSLCVDCIKAGFDIACTLKDGFNLFNRRCIKKNEPEVETDSGSTVLIISTVVGSVLAVIVIGVIFHYCLMLRRRAKYDKERKETAYQDMQEMEDQKETYSSIDEVYDQIKDLPDDYLTAQKTTRTVDDSEDGEGSYDQLGNAENNESEGYVYLNTLTTAECVTEARKQRAPLERPICIPKSPMMTIQTQTKMYEYK